MGRKKNENGLDVSFEDMENSLNDVESSMLLEDTKLMPEKQVSLEKQEEIKPVKEFKFDIKKETVENKPVDKKEIGKTVDISEIITKKGGSDTVIIRNNINRNIELDYGRGKGIRIKAKQRFEIKRSLLGTPQFLRVKKYFTIFD